MKKQKKDEFRYQFLGYEEVSTGKFTRHKLYGLGILEQHVSQLGGVYQNSQMVEIKKRIAMVFDKQTGEVKQTEIKKL